MDSATQLIGSSAEKSKSGSKTAKRQEDEEISALIADVAEPLPNIEDPSFGTYFDRFANRRVVLLGEASHGTSQFYRARAAITRRLIVQHGFNFVAVEADWPDAAALNRYVRHWPVANTPRAVFQRFPTWMWRNKEIDSLLHWMREFNMGNDAAHQVGFYGLDLYNLNAAMAEVIEYLAKVDPEAEKVARQRYGCLEPWKEEPAEYGRASLLRGYALCEKGVVKECNELLARELEYTKMVDDGDAFLDAAVNAQLVMDAEQYYRVMYYGGAESWNVRDSHMFRTLEYILKARGPSSKAIVWAHNSHIGDARFTDMGSRRQEINIGQLCREKFGNQCALIGFGTHTGTVAAADEWGGEMKIKRVRPSLPSSVERLCHDAHAQNNSFLLDLRAENRRNEQLRRRLMEKARLERFIGVIYRPDTERWSHYSESVLPKQFDAYVWFDETEAVTPLGPQHAKPGMPETYPFGL